MDQEIMKIKSLDKKIDFFQICYESFHAEHCYPFAKIIMRDVVDDYFENSVICDVVPGSDADIIGVASWRLRAKRADGPVPIILKNKLDLSPEVINSVDFDVAVLTPRSHKDVRNKLIVWHEWDGDKPLKIRDALKEFDKFFRIPETVANVIYENHFLARADLYKDYVSLCLAPAIDFMRSRPVFLEDSGYITRKRNRSEVEAYQKKSGRRDWPIAPFILERLFCSWIEGRGLKVVNL